jgi:hypothetical protein
MISLKIERLELKMIYDEIEAFGLLADESNLILECSYLSEHRNLGNIREDLN